MSSSGMRDWFQGYSDGQRDAVRSVTRDPPPLPEETFALPDLDGRVRGKFAVWCLGHNLAQAAHMYWAGLRGAGTGIVYSAQREKAPEHEAPRPCYLCGAVGRHLAGCPAT